jgi:hypothetical protein
MDQPRTLHRDVLYTVSNSQISLNSLSDLSAIGAVNLA